MANYERIFVRNAVIKAHSHRMAEMDIYNYHRDTKNDYFINRILSIA